ncbi:YqhR family membrane protein [Bacillus sp. NEB1478]|uniref:YqhR family membrane protein n=1 Tax=Bacillus sp. NEB1478 TaxID=3073816 RepID=UPI0028733FAD|nr:YqhR family membrane protein [Bacillus sp. NEB1478]WNB93574.1 YqhR family membrane protein [Bacillus sp. NEB1478]
MNENNLEQNKKESQSSFLSRVAGIGFFGGLIWSMFGFIAYYLNFSKVGPALVLAPWALGKWKAEWLGQLISIFIIALLSILVAIGYRFAFAKINSMWAGIIFGVGLWAIVFYLLHPIYPGLEPMNTIGKNTIITTICIYILYGVFVGYSISFEYNERYGKKGEKKQSLQST